MAKITINKESCKGCGLCVLSCPKKLLQISDKSNKNGYLHKGKIFALVGRNSKQHGESYKDVPGA